MSRIGTAVDLLRVYFWVLLLAILLGGAYLVNEYIIQSGAIASGYYAIGALAAKQTQTGRIGYLGGLTLPFSYAEVHAIEQAIEDLGADVELRMVWSGDFNDPSAARELADALGESPQRTWRPLRRQGILAWHELTREQGVLLVMPTKRRDKRGWLTSIHMLGVNSPLAVAWLDARGEVVWSRLARPWRPYYASPRPASFVLEVHAEHLPKLKVGELVSWHKAEEPSPS
jgi:uncharacterized membrane protein (UPF0127 family)